jgi:cysteine synthase
MRCATSRSAPTPLIDATSGSTAVSEAYFARLIGLPFIAVVPHGTSPAKIEAIRFHGGDVHFVQNAGEVTDAARVLALETGGHFLDQFTNAERATDWRGNNNIADTIFRQMRNEEHPVPTWIVCGAGTGGTSATIGRYIRYARHGTRLCVADPKDRCSTAISPTARSATSAAASARASKASAARGGAVFHAAGGRPDDGHSRCRIDRRHARSRAGSAAGSADQLEPTSTPARR